MPELALTRLFFLEVPDEEVVRRIIKRQEIEGRQDDTEDVIKNRLRVYKDRTAPLKDFYGKASVLRMVEGVGEISDIAEGIDGVLKQLQ